MADRKSNVTLSGMTAEIKTYTLDVSGRVAINFYALPASGVDYSTLKLVATYVDMSGATQTVEVAGADWKYFNATYGYVATMNAMNAAEMRSVVSAVVEDANGNVISNTYSTSIETYGKTIVDRAAADPSNASRVKLAALMKAMINYGDAARAYFVSVGSAVEQ